VDYSSPEVLFNAISSHTAYVNKNLKEIAKKADIEKHISFHSSRHTWATRALQKGMRIEHVSKLMGHSSLKTTMIYTKIENEELEVIVNRLKEIEKVLKNEQHHMEDPILNTEGVMTLLKVSRRSLQNWRDKRIIEFSAVGGKIYYRMSATANMLARNLTPELL